MISLISSDLRPILRRMMVRDSWLNDDTNLILARKKQ
jgi:hypothetical protein